MDFCITPDFEALIGSNRLCSLNNHQGSVYGLDSQFNISYLNPSWFKFAEENGNNLFDINNWSLGRCLFDSIPAEMESFYRGLLGETQKNKSSLISKQSEYECSSPELYRRFSMNIYPLGKDGLITVHSIIVEEPIKRSSPEGLITLDENNYIDENKFINQCANCRRIQNIKNLSRWDWVKKWIEKPYLNTSHGICPSCLQHYYKSNIANLKS